MSMKRAISRGIKASRSTLWRQMGRRNTVKHLRAAGIPKAISDTIVKQKHG